MKMSWTAAIKFGILSIFINEIDKLCRVCFDDAKKKNANRYVMDVPFSMRKCYFNYL